jgi:hypothetical protein
VSIIAWPNRARIPDRTSSSATTSPHRVVPADRSLVVRGLERPDEPSQPVQQTQVLGQAAEDRLHQVDVRLHQAGHDVAAGAIHDLRIRRHDQTGADLRDAGAADQQVAGDLTSVVAHRQERAAAEEDRHQRRIPRAAASGASVCAQPARTPRAP